ncbi:hypothetical protein CK203_063498 [Vitis vinifera]|uniref:Integrase catalytic domain-containing protein n=1 Tax=Vitis vinifera TaxID=29760 RepID=A0A438G6T9_VITVI|nr:hypothetical protein CK203_063498 [Vitis vinifera]
MRRLHPRWSLQVKEEIRKQLSVGFLSMVEYPEWLANVIPVPKKDGKVRVCVDFRDLNKASPKDDFPLPHIDMLVDSTAGHPILSFMDGFSRMQEPLIRELLTTLFHDMMHTDVETVQARLNPKKCTFGWLLENCSDTLLVRRAYLPPSEEESPTVWNDDCQRTFERIKECLLSPPVLVPPTPGRPLLLYLSVSDMALGCMLAQLDDLGKERAIYYLSKGCLIFVLLVSRLDPLRYLFDRPVLTGRLMRWLLLCDIDDRSVDDDFPDEQIVSMTSITGWRLYFDGAANQSGFGIGILLISPQGDHIPRSVRWRSTGIPIWLYSNSGYIHLPRAENQFCRCISHLGFYDCDPAGVTVRPLLIELVSVMRHLPESTSAKDRRALRQLATRFVICGDALYRRSPDGLVIIMSRRTSADRVMREVHAGRCQECQMHGDLIHVPPSELHALTSPWPFSVWGVDIIGKISPKSSSGHEYILVAIDYFTKGEVDTLIQEYGIQHHRSSAYRRQTNGAVEAANKNIKRILRKMVETSQDWSEKLPFALWAYRTSFRTSTGATPYSLVYGMEAVLPVEIEMRSLRVALEQRVSEAEWVQSRYDQLSLLDEKRLSAADHAQAYQRKMTRAFERG